MGKQMFGHDVDSGRTTLVAHIEGHDAATVIVKKAPKGTNSNAANWRVWSRHTEPRNRLFFQYLHDSPLPSQTDKYVEDGGKRSFTITAEGNKGWWAQQTQTGGAGGFKIPADLRFKIADTGQAA
jgi:hypothetical protein